MSVFVLKLIAIGTMFIDHLTYILALSGFLPYSSVSYRIGRAVGRIAFIIFAYLLVNGFDKTSDRRKYLGRLIFYAAVSQAPFTLAFTGGNYRSAGVMFFSFDAMAALPLLLPLAVYFFFVAEGRPDRSCLTLLVAFALAGLRVCVDGIVLLGGHMNVFYTLAVSMALMMALEALRSPDRSWPRALLCFAALGVELYFLQQNADYGLLGVALVIGMYFLRGRRALQLLYAAVWCAAEYYASPVFLVGAWAALVPLAFYNGKLGRKMRTAFYAFYPVHLGLLGLIFIILCRSR